MPESTELGARLQAAFGDAYVVQRELASGGMATVFLARDTKHDRLVALKVLRPEVAKTVGSQRFRHEIAVASRLEHPHILPIHDHGESAGDLLWYTMPYVEGESLRERMTRESQMPLADALRITREVASALDYAHGAGYMHRDVKPDNIMVTTKHDAMLADFGIARPMKDASGRSRAGAMDVEVAMTTTGFVVGSPQYMSPEQVGGDPSLDGRSDQYSRARCCTRCSRVKRRSGGETRRRSSRRCSRAAHLRFARCAPMFRSSSTTRSSARSRARGTIASRTFPSSRKRCTLRRAMRARESAERWRAWPLACERGARATDRKASSRLARGR